jgi:3-hydroxyacyl-CoA dehydrogenase/enoyl-CoA hydratase/carnithine racemase
VPPDTEFKLTRVGDLAVVTIDNGADHTKPTVLGRAALSALDRTLAELERGGSLRFSAAVFTGKPYVFAAGADIDEFPRADAERARAGSRAGHELFGRIRALPFPTLAAINGACLGGGVELALHCTARTISTAVRHFAAPEVALGIFPAWGGTQLVPRLVDAKTAIRFVVQNPLRQNRMLNGRAAFEAGFADGLYEPVEFLDESLAFARELASFERPGRDLSELVEAVTRARAQLDDTIHGAAPAPYVALELIAGADEWSLEEGYAREEDLLAELLPGRQAKASLYAFDLVERRAKRRVGIPAVEPRPVRRVGIVGAGLMARQLAALFLRRLELPLVLRDVEQEILDEALEFVREDLGEGDKQRFLAGLVTTTTGWDEFAGCDLVLEAVFEEVVVKKEVFAQLERVVSPECLLASNTSSLSLAEMAADLEHPERVVGLHFFNPVAMLPLVELVRAPETDDATLATAAAVAEKLRKRPVLVRDAPAFVVNRVLTRLTSVLMDAIEHGTPVEETDAAVMRLGLPMAPSVLLQMVGPRVAAQVLATLHDAYPERFPLSPTLQSYADGRDEVVVREHAPRTQEEVLDSALEAIADEVRHLLEEGVVAEAADVDTCLILGAGFPLWLGGITKFLDQTGVSQRVVGRPLAEVGKRVTV